MLNKRFFKLFIFVLTSFMMLGCDGGKELTTTPQQAKLIYNPRGNVIAGNPKGDVTLVEFFDYQCPYCRKMTPVIDKLIERDPNLRVVFKEYLLFGPSSEPATRAALAANKQGKYLEMRDALMRATKPLTTPEIMQIAKNVGVDTKQLVNDMAAPDISRQIDENNQLANQINITGAPVFIVASSSIANSQTSNPQLFLMGAASEEKLKGMISKVRK
jgi:protein-disulfide isomerase